MPWNEVIIPQTVPNSPTKGATAPIVAKPGKRLCKCLRASTLANRKTQARRSDYSPLPSPVDRDERVCLGGLFEAFGD